MVAAAGSGQRLGAGGPKAFVPLAGRPLVEWSLAALRDAPSVGAVVVACPPGHAHGLGDEVTAVDGGATRAESVANALAAVETELVAIHDAARPLVSAELVEAVIATLLASEEAAGAIAAAPVTDTIKRVTGPTDSGCNAFAGYTAANALHPGRIAETLDRSMLWAAQTPQVFRAAALRAALEVGPERLAAATDEASLVEAAGGTVLIHPAPAGNLKVTTPLDLRLAEALLAGRAGGPRGGG